MLGIYLGSKPKTVLQSEHTETRNIDCLGSFHCQTYLTSFFYMLLSTVSIVAWVTCNLELSFANKHFFKDYPLPFLALTGNVFISCVFSYICLWVIGRPLRPPSWRPVMVASLLRMAEIMMETLSLVHISVSLNQVLKACVPVFVVAMKREVLNPWEWLGVLLIVVGSILAVVQNGLVLGELMGVGAALVSALLAALYLVYTGDVVEKMNLLEISAYTGLIGLCLLVPSYFLFEYQHSQVLLAGHWPTLIAFVLRQSFVVFIYNVAGFGVLKFTSPLYMGLIGNLKSVLAVAIDTLFLGTEINSLGVQGVIITLLGFLLYNVEIFFKRREALANGEKEES